MNASPARKIQIRTLPENSQRLAQTAIANKDSRRPNKVNPIWGTELFVAYSLRWFPALGVRCGFVVGVDLSQHRFFDLRLGQVQPAREWFRRAVRHLLDEKCASVEVDPTAIVKFYGPARSLRLRLFIDLQGAPVAGFLERTARQYQACKPPMGRIVRYVIQILAQRIEYAGAKPRGPVTKMANAG